MDIYSQRISFTNKKPSAKTNVLLQTKLKHLLISFPYFQLANKKCKKEVKEFCYSSRLFGTYVTLTLKIPKESSRCALTNNVYFTLNFNFYCLI